jgi:serine/threonine protein kinase
MITDLLGPSLGDMFAYCNQQFSLKTTCMLFLQMIRLIRQLHDFDYIHRDIKPENFLFGYGAKSGQVFAVDFGLSKRWRSNGFLIPYRRSMNLVGTATYASYNTHMGHEQSRRDDLEAIGFMMISFLIGSLPWATLSK